MTRDERPEQPRVMRHPLFIARRAMRQAAELADLYEAVVEVRSSRTHIGLRDDRSSALEVRWRNTLEAAARTVSRSQHLRAADADPETYLTLWAELIPAAEFDEGARQECRALEARLARWWPASLQEYAERIAANTPATLAMLAVAQAFTAVEPTNLKMSMRRRAMAAAEEALNTANDLLGISALLVHSKVPADHEQGMREWQRTFAARREVWFKALDRAGSARAAGTVTLLNAWAAANPWVELLELPRREALPETWKRDAAEAKIVRRALEAALAERQPAAMKQFRLLVRRGYSRTEAMRAVAGYFLPDAAAAVIADPGARQPVLPPTVTQHTTTPGSRRLAAEPAVGAKP